MIAFQAARRRNHVFRGVHPNDAGASLRQKARQRPRTAAGIEPVLTDLLVETLQQLLPATGGYSILDLGCGDALFFDRLAKFGEVDGVEPSVELVRENNPHGSRIHVCPFDERFQPGKQCSAILMLDVLEHLEAPGGALRHVARLLKSGGMFVATVPAFSALWTNLDVLNHHRTRYAQASFRAVAVTQA